MMPTLTTLSTASLAVGATLTADTFNEFVSRLRNDCRGEGVREHCTADALFVVQSKAIVSGIDREFTDDWLVHYEEQTWYSPASYWKDLSRQDKAILNKKCVKSEAEKFLKLPTHTQWDVLEGLDDHTVTGYTERWDYVCAHFTKTAAEAFIKRKKHDYLELKVYVESQYWSWEFNAIKNALMDGTLVFKREK